MSDFAFPQALVRGLGAVPEGAKLATLLGYSWQWVNQQTLPQAVAARAYYWDQQASDGKPSPVEETLDGVRWQFRWSPVADGKYYVVQVYAWLPTTRS